MFQHARSISFAALRLMLGALFVFSGFVKSADPVGTSVFVEKYLATYSMEWLLPASLYIAVALGVVEMVLGAMLVLRLMLRRALFLTTLFLAIFTVVTLLSATLLPIGDCGCFGDAVKLTPWQTFLKNVVMLPVAVWLYRGSDKGLIVRRDAVWLSALFVVAIAINVYAIRHLPLIDFMPYKVGLDLRSAVDAERHAEAESVRNILVFRDKATGERREFKDTDTACWMDENLEYEDAYVRHESHVEMQFSDLRIYDAQGQECSMELLQRNGRYAWLLVRGVDMLYGDRLRAVERLRMAYPDTYIIVIAAADRLAVEELLSMTCYEMDAMTMRSMMRAEVGVVVIDDGVIIDKRSFRDI